MHANPWRPAQYDHCKCPCLQKDEGKIVLAGALADPVDSALFIWKNSSKEVPTHPAAYKAH